MDTEQKLMGSIAEINETFINASITLRSKSKFKNVHHGFDVRKYHLEYPIMEIFIDAEINDNLSYCWWLDVHFNPVCWKVDMSLLKTTNGVQEELSKFLQSSNLNVDSLIRELEKINRILPNLMDEFLFQIEINPKN